MSPTNPQAGVVVLSQANDALVLEVERLSVENMALKRALGLDLVPVLPGLTPTMREMLGVLLKREYANQHALNLCLRESSNPDTVKVHICKIRKWLKTYFGVRLYTRYSQGWFIDQAGKKHILDYISSLRQDHIKTTNTEEHAHEPPQLDTGSTGSV